MSNVDEALAEAVSGLTEELIWVRYQIAILVMAIVAVVGVFRQAHLQSKEDHERDEREKKRDQVQQNIATAVLQLVPTTKPSVATLCQVNNLGKTHPHDYVDRCRERVEKLLKGIGA